MARVTYDGNGYTEGSVPVDPQEYTSMDTAVVADPGTMKCAGAVFSHWESSLNMGSYSPKQHMRITKSVTMRAIWSPLCTVIYDASTAANVSGDVPVDVGLHALGDVITVPAHDLITAYIAMVKQDDGQYELEGMVTCLGWRILIGGRSDKEVLVSGDTFEVTDRLVVLQAVWGTPDITIAYESGNITGSEIPPQRALQFRPVTIAALPDGTTRPGYKFAEWKDYASGITYLPGEEAVFAASTVLEAVWYPDTTCKVTYDLNGGTGAAPEPQTVEYGEYITLPETTPLRSGYTFGGWIVPFGDRTTWYEYSTAVQVTSDITIVARWVPTDTSKVFSLTYRSTESDIITDEEPPEDDTVYVSGDYAFVQSWFPIKHGRYVSGWADDKGNVYEFGSHVRFAGSSIVLTAVWADESTVTLTFHPLASTASGSVDDIITSGTYTVQLPSANLFVRDGYLAAGWVRIVDGVPTTERYDSGEIYHVPEGDGTDAEVQFGVEWIDESVAHTVKYEDALREFGHIPVDPCVYHAGELIPLPPAGDLRRDGYRLAGWVDVKYQKFYRIPTKSEIEKLMSDDPPYDYNLLTTYAVCRDDHVFRALWMPTLTLLFGGVGSTGGTPPSPVELIANETYYLPECGTLEKTGYAFCGWQNPSDSTDRIYHAGSKFVYTGEPHIILQPVWKAANIVEYVIPPELAIANTDWVPKNKYVFDHKPFRVDVPPEMAGRYVWMRSDNGEKVAEPCDIETGGDLVLTLIPAGINEPDDYPMCISRLDYGDRPYEGKRIWSDSVRIGYKTKFLPHPGLTCWVADNDPSRVYSVDQWFPIYGNTTFRAVYGDRTEVNDGYHVVYVMPTGASAEAPVDSTNYAAGEFATAPPHNGTRGPNGTNMLYWYTVDVTSSESDDTIVTRYYPNEKIYIPNTADPVYGKIVNPTTKVITLHPMFGDKFTLAFTDTTGGILPISPSGDAEYVYSTHVAEDQAIRIPKIVELERSAKSYANWINAWEYPCQGTSNTVNATVYAGPFETILEPESSNLVIGTVILLMCGGWVIYRFIQDVVHAITDTVKTALTYALTPFTSTITFELGETGYDENINWRQQPLPPQTGLWFSKMRLPKPDPFVESTCVEPIGWRRLGDPDNQKYIPLQEVQYGRVDATYVIEWGCPFDVCYRLMPKDILPGWKPISSYYGPLYNQHRQFKKCQRMLSPSVSDRFDPPLYGRDFTVRADSRASAEANDARDNNELYMICDRWFPATWEGGKIVAHRALRDYSQNLSQRDLWLWARNTIGGYAERNKEVRVPNPSIPTDQTYFQLVNKHHGDAGVRKKTRLVEYDLRWAPVVEITYCFWVQNFLRNRKRMTISRSPNYVGSTPQLEYEPEYGGNLKGFTRHIPPVTFERTDELWFKGWQLKENSDGYRYYRKLYDKGETQFDPDAIHHSGTLLPPIRVDSVTKIEFVGVYTDNEDDPGIEPKPIKVDGDSKKAYPKSPDLSLIQGNANANKNDKETQRASNGGYNKQNANSACMEGVTMMCVGERIDPSTAYNNCKIAGTMYKIRDAFRGPSTFVTFDYDDATATIDEKDTGEAETLRDDSDETIEPEREPGGKLVPDTQAVGDPVPEPEQSIDYWKYVGYGIEAIQWIGMICKFISWSSQGSKYHEAVRIDQDLIPGGVGEIDMKTGNGKRLGAASYAASAGRNINAEIHQRIRNLRDGAVLMSGMDSSRISLKSGYKLMDADTDTAATAKRINLGWAETMTVKTITGPDGEGSIPVIDYIPRDPTADDVYFAGDVVEVPEGKHLCRVDYLTFANTYDDYIIGYADTENRTYDDTFLEPHEYHTVLDCAVPTESRPEGKVFAGWIVDDSTETIAQPGDQILQGLGSHNFRAVWVDEDPTLWGDA